MGGNFRSLRSRRVEKGFLGTRNAPFYGGWGSYVGRTHEAAYPELNAPPENQIAPIQLEAIDAFETTPAAEQVGKKPAQHQRAPKACDSHFLGSSAVNVVPDSALEDKLISPPWAPMIFFAI
jgi:hypothetical protein